MSWESLLAAPVFSLPQEERELHLLAELNALTALHREGCEAYRRVTDLEFAGNIHARRLSEVPYLPVGVFKSHRLASVAPEQVFKTLTSSGTTGQQVSRVCLDRNTAARQAAALVRVMGAVLGPKRMPMLVIDSSALFSNRAEFSARAAGVLGMMNLGAQHVFALDDAMRLDLAAVRSFLDRHGSRPFAMFGFTFMVWEYFHQQVKGLGIDLANGILVHSGGWKKLIERAVTNEVFKRELRESTGLARVHNFYGMVEQVGSVFVEGEDGFLYAPPFADVVIRDPKTWTEAPIGEVGVVQVLSAVPLSYPGHSLLTEDLGVLHGVDDGPCGRRGKYFSVVGRVPRAELRGCSDTHAFDAAGAS